MKKKLVSLIFSLLPLMVLSQELNCTVQVLAPQVQGSDRRVFETLKTAITEFINGYRWTGDSFKGDERIECSMIITISDRLSVDEFKGNIQVQSRRPVYRTSYNTTLLNYMDQDLMFKYVEFQPLEFNENTFTNNLVSVLAFYSYIILGLDYDTFSPDGGSVYYQKAQGIVNNAQGAPERGWKAFEGNRNRYWLAENLSNANFKGLRDCLYKYHRLGLDVMSADVEEGRKAIYEALELLRKVHQLTPGSFIMQVFFVAKADEVVNVFSQADPSTKSKIIPLLGLIDPANNNKYIKIQG
jgi:hypothetical protein